METKNNMYDRIELRSEKVRDIIGAIPSGLALWGIAVFVIILLALLLVLFCIPYPYGDGETIFHHLFFS